jgi:signal transduction histidine kinase/CheY-like chemotaxis protein
LNASAIRAGVVGFAGGLVVVVATLAVELVAQGLPLRGGLLALQRDSVLVWVVESLPFVIGGAAWALASASGTRHVVLPEAPQPVAPPSGAPAPPPVPDALQGANLLGHAGADHRVRALEELVRVLREQAAKSATESRAKSAYLANMSHELRTPLNAIIGYAEMLAEEAEDRGYDLQDDLNKVADAAHMLVELINNILDLSKIEVGQLAVVLEDVDLAQVADEVRVAVAPLIHQNDNAFSIRLAPDARLARGDHMRIRQILVNLLGNAFKFTDAAHVTLTIERATPKRDAWIALRVRDSGVGLSPRDLERVLDVYRQAEAADRPHGTGLGLPISKMLAELMGGRIEAESEPGVGSTFTLVLPPAALHESQVPARSTVALNERLQGQSLLLLDGSPTGVSLARYLERAGLEVELITDVVSWRIAARAQRPDMVILDVQLPAAWGLAEELLADRVPVVALSLRDSDVESALERGVTAFLTRPVSRRLVLATLERCLEA